MKYIFISHRGNLSQKTPNEENTVSKIEKVIALGFNVEIDIWKMGHLFYLGHDFISNWIPLEFLFDFRKKLFIHCKNFEALEFLRFYNELNIFWHENDKHTITACGYIWNFPCHDIKLNSINVMPETNGIIPSDFLNVRPSSDVDYIGICSDRIMEYKEIIQGDKI